MFSKYPGPQIVSVSQKPGHRAMFDALVIRDHGGSPAASVESLSVTDLPKEGEILVRVPFSGLNYKDALAVTGEGKIVRASYPFVPGIDLVGQVAESDSEKFSQGDWVIATGGGLGETSWGGYSGLQRISDEWLVRLPAGLSSDQAMVVGTAGLTAMLAVMSIESHGQTPEMGPIVVTGATGGVGSFAVLFLSNAGFNVVASTGKTDRGDYLTNLGAASVIERSSLSGGAKRPLDSANWAGAVDTLGGAALEGILSQTARHGNVAACGLADSAQLNTTVYPFILRGVNLLGIDSNTCPVNLRQRAWDRLAGELDAGTLNKMTTRISLSDIPEQSRELLAGRISGRILVEIPGSLD